MFEPVGLFVHICMDDICTDTVGYVVHLVKVVTHLHRDLRVEKPVGGKRQKNKRGDKIEC
jgi:hypothetical protein